MTDPAATTDSMWPNWVLDASLSMRTEGPYPWCPIEDGGTIVTGMTFLAAKPPGRMVAIVHEDGQAAVEAWMEAHPEILERLRMVNE